MVIDAGTGKGHEFAVFVSHGANDAAHLDFAFGLRDVKFAVEFEFFGHLSIEVFETRNADDIEHDADVVGSVGNIFHGMVPFDCRFFCLVGRAF